MAASAADLSRVHLPLLSWTWVSLEVVLELPIKGTSLRRQISHSANVQGKLGHLWWVITFLYDGKALIHLGPRASLIWLRCG